MNEPRKEYYLVQVTTTRKDDQMVELDERIARDIHLSMGDNSRVWRLNGRIPEVLMSVYQGIEPIDNGAPPKEPHRWDKPELKDPAGLFNGAMSLPNYGKPMAPGQPLIDPIRDARTIDVTFGGAWVEICPTHGARRWYAYRPIGGDIGQRCGAPVASTSETGDPFSWCQQVCRLEGNE